MTQNALYKFFNLYFSLPLNIIDPVQTLCTKILYGANFSSLYIFLAGRGTTMTPRGMMIRRTAASSVWYDTITLQSWMNMRQTCNWPAENWPTWKSKKRNTMKMHLFYCPRGWHLLRSLSYLILTNATPMQHLNQLLLPLFRCISINLAEEAQSNYSKKQSSTYVDNDHYPDKIITNESVSEILKKDNHC